MEMACPAVTPLLWSRRQGGPQRWRRILARLAAQLRTAGGDVWTGSRLPNESRSREGMISDERGGSALPRAWRDVTRPPPRGGRLAAGAQSTAGRSILE